VDVCVHVCVDVWGIVELSSIYQVSTWVLVCGSELFCGCGCGILGVAICQCRCVCGCVWYHGAAPAFRR